MASAAARAQPSPRRAPQPRRAREAPRPAPRRTRAARPRLAGSVVWIVLVAALLAGIVALNVGALRLNMQAEELERQRDDLSAKRDALDAELSRAAAAGRIEAIAVRRYGLVRPEQPTYIRLARVEE
jgi:cell division protein FtsL